MWMRRTMVVTYSTEYQLCPGLFLLLLHALRFLLSFHHDDLLKRFSSGVVAEVASSIFVESFADATEPAEERLRHLFSLGVADQAGNVGVQLDGRVHQTTAHVDHLQLWSSEIHGRSLSQSSAAHCL